MQLPVFSLPHLELITPLDLGSYYAPEWVNLAFSQLPAGSCTGSLLFSVFLREGDGQQWLQKFTLETCKFAFSYDIIEQ